MSIDLEIHFQLVLKCYFKPGVLYLCSVINSVGSATKMNCRRQFGKFVQVTNKDIYLTSSYWSKLMNSQVCAFAADPRFLRVRI